MSGIIVLVGNPRPGSRTHSVAERVGSELAARLDREVGTIDLAELGPVLLSPGDPTLPDVLERIGGAEVLVAATPTYKGTYTGLLKLVLDALPHRGLTDVVTLGVVTAATHDNAAVTGADLERVFSELGASSAGEPLLVDEPTLKADPDAVVALVAAHVHTLPGLAGRG